MEVGKKGDYIPIGTRVGHYQNGSCIKMVSDDSHFNCSLIVWDSHKTVSTNHNLFEEKARRVEAESSRCPSAYQSNALPLDQTGSPTHTRARARALTHAQMHTRTHKRALKILLVLNLASVHLLNYESFIPDFLFLFLCSFAFHE